jgi:hypothetical protein
MSSPEIGFAVICTGLLVFFVLLFGTLALMRWFRHKERLAMIERGLMPADAVKPRNGKATLAWGIGITAFGLAVLCGMLPLGWRTSRGFLNYGPLLLPGLIVLFMGVALIIIHFVTRPMSTEEGVEEALSPAQAGGTTDLPALELEEDEEPLEE